MEKGLARFGVSLLCFCCDWFCCGLLRLVCCGWFCRSWFVAAGLLQLVCCAEVADSRRRSFPLRGPLPFSGANAACGCLPPQRRRNSNRVLAQCPVGLPMPPAAVCHLSAAGTPTASWSSAQSGCQCLLRLSATSAPRVLQPRPGPVPCRAVDASCGCLPSQRCWYSNRVLARGPCPQVLQRHPGVAKGTSIDPLARGPSTELLLGQGHVARLSGTGVKPVSCRCFGRTSARHPRREASRWHPGVAKGTSIGSSSIKCRYSMDIEVRIGCLSMKCRCSMDVEVRKGFLSIKCRCFMDVEVQVP